MEIKTLRKLILIVIALLVASECARQLATVVVGAWGILVGLIVAAVFWFCGRQARAGVGYQAWIIVPTLIFTIIPMGWRTWQFFGADKPSLPGTLVGYVPFVFSFVVPIVLLLVVYVSLGKKQQPEN